MRNDDKWRKLQDIKIVRKTPVDIVKAFPRTLICKAVHLPLFEYINHRPHRIKSDHVHERYCAPRRYIGEFARIQCVS